jgi:hypothetical protein
VETLALTSWNLRRVGVAVVGVAVDTRDAGGVLEAIGGERGAERAEALLLSVVVDGDGAVVYKLRPGDGEGKLYRLMKRRRGACCCEVQR